MIIEMNRLSEYSKKVVKAVSEALTSRVISVIIGIIIAIFSYLSGSARAFYGDFSSYFERTEALEKQVIFLNSARDQETKDITQIKTDIGSIKGTKEQDDKDKALINKNITTISENLNTLTLKLIK